MLRYHVGMSGKETRSAAVFPDLTEISREKMIAATDAILTVLGDTPESREIVEMLFAPSKPIKKVQN